MASTIGVIAEASRRELVRELAAASEPGAPHGAQREPDDGGADPGDHRAEQSDREHEEHDDAEGCVRRVGAGRGGGDSREGSAADEGRDAERGTDPAERGAFHGCLGKGESRLHLGGTPRGEVVGTQRGDRGGGSGDGQGQPGDMQCDGLGDGSPVLELPEPPVGQGDSGQAAERSGERGDEQGFGGDGAAQLARGGTDGAEQGELAAALAHREGDRTGGGEDGDHGGDAAEGSAEADEEFLGARESRVLDGAPVVAGVDLGCGGVADGLVHLVGEGVVGDAAVGEHGDGVDPAGVAGELYGLSVGEPDGGVGGGGARYPELPYTCGRVEGDVLADPALGAGGDDDFAVLRARRR